MLTPVLGGVVMTQELTATLLGYASIACWLCAQFPQVMKNVKLKSCDGLALPFLVNWLFGDITNIIGCILTNQLPFQTYLAGYFCLVDLTLVVQYFYYKPLTHTQTPPSRPISYSYISPHQSLVLPTPTSQQISFTTSPIDRNHARSISHPPLHVNTTTNSAFPHRIRPKRNPYSHYSVGSTSQLRISVPDISVVPAPKDGYQAIYAAALDVARAAERVSEGRSRSRRRRLASNVGTESRRPSRAPSLRGDGDHMTASFHSELSGSTETTGDENGDTYDVEAMARMTASTPAILNGRGRSLQRPQGLPGQTELGDEGSPAHTYGQGEMREIRSKSRSISMVRGSGGRGKGRRAAGVAFMSFGLLVGCGSWDHNRPVHRGGSERGAVISPYPVSDVASRLIPSHPFILVGNRTPVSMVTYIEHNDHNFPHPPIEPPSFQRVVGRISAWTCTTLYLTSRLPQIWKNFTRKSVEGLSILLFLFAFCGNLLYVLSILLNPLRGADPSESSHYLLEALPYLLGSGGTLIFDLTIMIQSFFYGSSPPVPSSPLTIRRKGLSRRRYQHVEDGSLISTERQPLISARGTLNERDRSVSAGGSAMSPVRTVASPVS